MIQKRETSKDIALLGRNFRINKFDAMTGSYIAYQLMGSSLPFGVEQQAGLKNMPKKREKMSKAEFLEFQIDCLSVCEEVLPAGNQPVINPNGNFGVADADVKLALLLTINALIFNISDFFDESLLTSLSEALSQLVPTALSDAKT